MDECFYLEQAEKELAHRRQIPGLLLMIEQFVDGVPEILSNGPRAVLARYVATPNLETVRFLELASGNGLNPVVFEFQSDILHFKNPAKRHLVDMVFNHGTGRNGGPKEKKIRVVNFGRYEGKPFGNIKTCNGETLVDFHHRLISKVFPEVELWDLSDWLGRNGGRAYKYYEKFLSLFIAHSILFENFLKTSYEAAFTEKVVQPAIRRLQEIFGYEPLIIPLCPPETANCNWWYHYNGENTPKLLPLI